MKTSLLSFLLFLFFAIAKGQTNKPLLTDNRLHNHIDFAVDKGAKIYMNEPNTVGLSIGLYDHGKYYTYNYGEIKKGTSKLPSADNYYNLGSVAKTFVTTLLAEAVIEKRINLNDDIRKYLPGKYPNLQYRGHPVRLINLANHTSGLPGLAHTYPDKVKDSLKKLSIARQLDFYNKYNADSLLKDLHTFKVDTIPGTKFRYNSNAVMVLVLLLERIYHEPYEKLITHYLKTHLKMYDTHTIVSPSLNNRFPTGYDSKNQSQVYANFLGFYTGPSMNSTINDMLKYLHANLSEKDPAIKLTHNATWKNTDGTGIGLGWMIDTDYKGAKIIFHDGNTALGFNTLCLFYPGRSLGYIIIVNDVISQQRIFDLQKNIQQGLDNQH